MATYSQSIRKGLPRVAGGPAWPDVEGAVVGEAVAQPVAESVAGVQPVTSAQPAADAAPATAAAGTVAAEVTATEPAAVAAEPAAVGVESATGSAVAAGEPAAAVVMTTVALRRGLPRTPGGEPWPPAGEVTVERAAVAKTGAGTETQAPVATATVAAEQPQSAAAREAAPAQGEPAQGTAAPAAAANVSGSVAAPAASAGVAAAGVAAAQAGVQMVSEEVTLRQGLPRTPGGEPWPAAGTVTVQRAVAETPTAAAMPAEAASAAAAPQVTETSAASLQAESSTASAAETPAQSVGRHAAPETSAPAAAALVAAQESPSAAATAASSALAATPATSAPATPATPAPATPATSAAAKPAAPAAAPAAAKPAKPAREPVMIGSRTLGQWTKLAVLWGGGAIVAAGIIVLAARGLTTLPGVPEFLERYPGEYELPEFVEPGFPVWVRWAHFLNFFMMVLIIRSGLLVRKQQKPDAFFTPKKGGKKISIYLWLHTSIDVLWLLNGVAFVVLLFVTGHWARIVPTSWEVFPNALSAGIQYLTLEWPIEDGWVNYNSLQQLMYFTVIFIAAPLAAITGVRMSEWWPEKAEKLNKLYPAPVARAIHYPTMLFFVLFILVHVFLVFTTGALKNLNHMFAGTPEISWTGFWWFAGSVLVTAAVTWAARPLVLAPIANLFGRVSER